MHVFTIAKKSNLIILAMIIILAAFLRLKGIVPGYPPYHSDEGISYSSAVSMIKNKNFDPLRYDYPAVVPLVNVISFESFFLPFSWASFYVRHIPDFLEGTIQLPLGVSEYKRFFQLEVLGARESYALSWGRYTTALFGIANVLLVYFIGNRLFNRSTGLVAALLMAVNYRQVLNSHIGLPDTYNAFFLLLSFIVTLKLYANPSRQNYLLASLAAGLSVATKYQFFALLPLLMVHLLVTFKQSTSSKKLHFLFSKNAILVPFVVLVVFLLINPYHLIHFEETKEWLTQVAGKYRTGRMELDVYSFSYLYHIGLGKVTSLLVVLGSLVLIYKDKLKFLLIFSVIVPFFFITSFYTGGGFYTRNFITITPFLLILAGGLFYYLPKLQSLNRYVLTIIFLIVVGSGIWENTKNSYVLAVEYSKPWNIEQAGEWIQKNIPVGSKVAGHSSVPLPKEGYTRLPYDFQPAFSMSEFAELGANYAIANLDWTTADFYWWMTQSFAGGIKYWKKPVSVLEQTYPALTIRELEDFSVAAFTNPWQAYESNFIVAKVPNYTVTKVEVEHEFYFDETLDGWEKNIVDGNDSLSYSGGNLKIGSGTFNANAWESPLLEVSEWEGVIITGLIQKVSTSQKRDGFIWIKFYESRDDSTYNAIRISSRVSISNDWEEKELVATKPVNAKFIKVGFQAYETSGADYQLDQIKVYNASVVMDTDGVTLQPIDIDEDVLFPSSHGGL